MGVIGSNYIDMLDVEKYKDGDGKVSNDVIEMLAALSPVYRFGHWAPCNMGVKHRHVIRTGLPTPTWGRLYQGIKQSKSSSMQVEDTTGMLEGLAPIDERVLKLFPGQENQIRLNEAEAYVESMMQEFETGFFYHDTETTPEKFKGIGARYDTLDASGATAGSQIIDAGGTGSDNTSIWFITWGDKYTSLIHPKGMRGGIDREDMGRQRVLDENGDPYYVKEEKFELHAGLTVGDWRYNSRIANIDVSELADGNVNLPSFMRKAMYKLKNRQIAPRNGRLLIYMNKTVLEALDAASTNAAATDNFIRLKPREVQGEELETWRKIPIVESEGILNTEARVT